jgi:DNA polymerase-4
VGPATLAKLERRGVRTVGDIADLPEDALLRLLGRASGRHLRLLARGVDPRPVEPEQRAKSIGHEETFPTDRHDSGDLGRELVRMADAVAWRLRRDGRAARTVTLKVRFGDFRTITRSTTLAAPVDEGPALARAAGALLAGIDPSPGVRLLGVTASGLVEAAVRQLTFDDEDGPSWHDASGAVDAIRERFGSQAIGPASAVGPGGLRVKRQGDTQWGPDDVPPPGAGRRK